MSLSLSNCKKSSPPRYYAQCTWWQWLLLLAISYFHFWSCHAILHRTVWGTKRRRTVIMILVFGHKGLLCRNIKLKDDFLLFPVLTHPPPPHRRQHRHLVTMQLRDCKGLLWASDWLGKGLSGIMNFISKGWLSIIHYKSQSCRPPALLVFCLQLKPWCLWN